MSMSRTRGMLAEMRATRRDRFRDLAGLTEEQLNVEGVWSRGPMDVRFMLLHIADHEDDHRLQLAGLLVDAGARQSRAARILGHAETTRGELLGALVGLTDADLDLTPPGEWPLRHTLAHILHVERRYLCAVWHAVELFRAGQPFVPPTEDGAIEPASLAGATLDAILAKLDDAREQVISELASLPDADLTAPTVWAKREIDVNYRLLRFAEHEREHTAHILKWRGQVGRGPTEAQRVLGYAWRARGMLHAQLTGLDDDWLDRDLDGVTPRQLLDHILASETYLKRQITAAGRARAESLAADSATG